MYKFFTHSLVYATILSVYLFLFKTVYTTSWNEALWLITGVIFFAFSLCSLIVYVGKSIDATQRVQRFMVGTTLQLLITLFFLLYLKANYDESFRPLAIHLLVEFGVCLFAQLIIFLLHARKE